MTIVGDRFIEMDSAWMCLATGIRVDIRFDTMPAPDLISNRRAVVLSRRPEDGRVLVDCGECGEGRWFEAHADPRDVGIARARVLRAGTIVRSKRPDGFVVVDPTLRVPPRIRKMLRHRHLVLLADTTLARDAAGRWLVELALVSDRVHQVVGADRAPSRGHPTSALTLVYSRAPHEARVVRERMVATASQLRRADTLVRRRRVRPAEQWYAAGVAAARRRGDLAGVVAAATAWVDCLRHAGQLRRAAGVAHRLLAVAEHPAERIALAVAAGRAHLDAARLSRAVTFARLALAVAGLASIDPPSAAVELQAECRFWSGAYQDGLAEIDGRPESLTPWRSALLWGQSRSGRLDVLVNAHIHGESPMWQLAIDLQHCLDAGDLAGAARLADQARPRPPGARGLVDLVLVHLRHALKRATPNDAAWLESHRIGGLEHWGPPKDDMQTLHDIAALLEIAQTTDDEVQGLRRMCEWVRSACAADVVTILGTPGIHVAGDLPGATGLDAMVFKQWIDAGEPGLLDRDTCAIVHAPIRFVGTTAGVAVLCGNPGGRRGMLDAARAVGAVAGPLVRARLDAMAAAAGGDALSDSILGAGPAVAAIRSAVARAAAVPFPVLIEGESGTGKELVARALHRLSPRRSRAFAALNCAALTDELAEAELFGHAKGAFTHAVAARAGLFEQAHQGTLFLDEVGDLSARAQAKLLRALQEGEIRRVGENDPRSVDVRVVAATNRPLAGLAAGGVFREDLLFRLSVIRIQMPPLRERVDDVPVLALSFWRDVARRAGTRALLAPDALALLSSLPWPGNVRQLQNTMAALAVAAPAYGRVGARLVRHVMDADAEAGDIVPLEQARRAVERRVVAAALARHTGSRAEAARALGLSRQGLAKALRRLGLSEAGVA